MIRKPDAKMRSSFWHADAWAAARAERLPGWHTSDSRYPLLSKAILAAFLLGALMTSVTLFAFTVGFLIIAGIAMNGLRRMLMYWSIRRYGGWHEMAPEMREELGHASDLAARPTSFARLPKGFTSISGAAAPRPKPALSLSNIIAAVAALAVLVPMFAELF